MRINELPTSTPTEDSRGHLRKTTGLCRSKSVVAVFIANEDYS